MPGYVLPSLRLALDHQTARAHLVLAVAAWLRYLRGDDYAGQDLGVQDAHAERLRDLAQLGGTDPGPLLAQQDLFGCSGGSVQFARELERALEALEEGPLETAALQHHLDEELAA